MTPTNVSMFPAGQLETGQVCPACQEPVQSGQVVGRCPACSHVQHERCWSERGRCHSYECDAATSIASGRRAPDLVVTVEDTARAVVTVAPRVMVIMPSQSADTALVQKRLSVLAIIAFVTSLVGVTVFAVPLLPGALSWMLPAMPLPSLAVFLLTVPAVAAIVLGAIATGLINSRRDLKGTGFSVAALIIGVLDLVCAAAIIAILYLHGGFTPEVPMTPPDIARGDRVPEVKDLANVPEPIRRAIRANVVILTSGASFMSSGAGVIVERRGGEIVIVTNRHVVEGGGGLLGGAGRAIRITFADGTKADAKVKWSAPDGIDLILLTCPAGAAFFETARVASRPKLAIGETVFAIGNPLGLGWSYCKGVISAIRDADYKNQKSLRMIQMQIPLNPGNSGGGLYDQDGALIGVNTFKTDRHVAEGIGFAIALADLIPFIEKEGGVSLETVPPRPHDPRPEPAPEKEKAPGGAERP